MTKWKHKTREKFKRKKSSDSSDEQRKVSRLGGSSGDQEVSEVDTSISDVLKQSNDVLYNDINDSITVEEQQPDTSTSSVFESSELAASSTDKESIMATGGGGGENENPSNTDIMRMLQSLNTKMEKIDKKLERLDSVEKKVDKFETEFKSLWTFIHDNHRKLEDRLLKVEDSLESKDFSAGLLADKITEMQKAADKTKEELTYIQSQSMRNNLLFSNIPEDNHESGEVTEEKLRSFMTDKLKLANETVKEIKFERVHRVGRKSSVSTCRQIVAKFCYFKDREMVKKQRGKLKGTNFFVSEQFPKEIVEKRKRLTPKMMEARKAGKSAWIAYDTLYIDGRAVKDGNL